jgi:hypothetical protein
MVPAPAGIRESVSSAVVANAKEIFIGNPFIRGLDDPSRILRLSLGGSAVIAIYFPANARQGPFTALADAGSLRTVMPSKLLPRPASVVRIHRSLALPERQFPDRPR